MTKNDTSGSVNELNEALKLVMEIIKLSNEMKKSNCDKETVQNKLIFLKTQLNENLLGTQIIQNAISLLCKALNIRFHLYQFLSKRHILIRNPVNRIQWCLQ